MPEGAGIIGEYEICSFYSAGKGSFLGSEASSPSVGRAGCFEEVAEGRLEMICPKDRLPRAISAMVETHPYEEPAYDIYPMEDFRYSSHYVWVGELPKPARLADLAKPNGRVIGNPGAKVKRIAAASGAGRSLLKGVADLKAEAFLTGEIGHHDRRLAEDLGLPVVEMGHFQSEQAFGSILAGLLRKKLRGKGVAIRASRLIRCP